MNPKLQNKMRDEVGRTVMHYLKNGLSTVEATVALMGAMAIVIATKPEDERAEACKIIGDALLPHVERRAAEMRK